MVLSSSVLVATVFAKDAHAQDSLAFVQAEAYPRANRTDRDQVGMSIFRVRAGYPIFLTANKKTLLIPSVSYERFDASIYQTTGAQHLVLHAPIASVMFVSPIALEGRLSMIASLGLGLASDFSTPVDRSDVAPTALGILTYRATDKLTFGAGATYDRRVGTVRPVPLLLLNWQLSESLRIRGAMPSTLSLEKRLSPWLSTALRGSLAANRFRFGQETIGDRLQVSYLNIGVGPSIIFSRGEYLHLEVYGTAAVYRRFEIFQQQDSVRTETLPAVMGWGARLWVGPSLWKTTAGR